MLSRIRKNIDERDEGFTLIELLVVMIIIGILAAIAIPVFLNQRNSGYDAGVKSDLKNASTAEETSFTDSGAYVGVAAYADLAITGWSKSTNTTSVQVKSLTNGYKLSGLSKSGKYFCFDSTLSGSGVTSNGTTACT